VLAAVALAGCGGGEDELRVSAAASLREALAAYDPAASFSFAGSDELAAQIRRGARPDVYVAANTDLPRALLAEGLVERPVDFATNRLVVAVPRDGAVRALRDLERAGVSVAVGAESVPVGAYTRGVLARMGARRAARIARNIRSAEPDVTSIVGKLAAGAVDAGFVYLTDVRASGGRLRPIELPAALRPRVTYAAAVVRGARRVAEARRFVAGLRAARGREALAAAGFEGP
jgi:molybdate transport system substrate-binding protein